MHITNVNISTPLIKSIQTGCHQCIDKIITDNSIIPLSIQIIVKIKNVLHQNKITSNNRKSASSNTRLSLISLLIITMLIIENKNHHCHNRITINNITDNNYIAERGKRQTPINTKSPLTQMTEITVSETVIIELSSSVNMHWNSPPTIQKWQWTLSTEFSLVWC